MKLFLEYFGFLIFAFVVLVGGIILLPTVTSMPDTTAGETVGLVLGFAVIAGGFTWFYFASSHQGRGPESVDSAG